LHPRRIITIVIASGGLGLGCLSLLGGCSDESKTTGTQLQLTPKDKAEIEEMRGAMKGQRAELKQEQAEGRKKKGR
jgi:hypothetical protein